MDRCTPRITDACLSITKIWECLEQTSFFNSMSSSSQYFFKSKLLSQASFLRNVLTSLHVSHFNDYNHLFLKLVSAIFLFFTTWQSLNNCDRYLFHIKSSFCSRNIELFVFPSSPLFFLAGNWFRESLEKTLRVYIIN